MLDKVNNALPYQIEKYVFISSLQAPNTSGSASINMSFIGSQTRVHYSAISTFPFQGQSKIVPISA